MIDQKSKRYQVVSFAFFVMILKKRGRGENENKKIYNSSNGNACFCRVKSRSSGIADVQYANGDGLQIVPFAAYNPS